MNDSEKTSFYLVLRASPGQFLLQKLDIPRVPQLEKEVRKPQPSFVQHARRGTALGILGGLPASLLISAAYGGVLWAHALLNAIIAASFTWCLIAAWVSREKRVSTLPTPTGARKGVGEEMAFAHGAPLRRGRSLLPRP